MANLKNDMIDIIMSNIRSELLVSRTRCTAAITIIGVLCLFGIVYIGYIINFYWNFLVITILTGSLTLMILRWPFLGLLVMGVLLPAEELTKVVAGEHTLIWLLGIVTLCACLLRTLVSPKKIRGALRPTLLAGLWSLWGLASYFWAYDPNVTLEKFFILVQLLGFFIVIQTLIRTEQDLRILAWVMFGAAVAFSLLGIGLVSNAGIRRLALVEIQNPAHLAFSLGLGLLMMPYLFKTTQKNLWKAIILFGIVATVVAIVLTGTRGAWLALGAALGFSYIATRGRLIQFKSLLMGGILIGLTLVILHRVGLIQDWIIERAITIFNIKATHGGAGRTRIWAVGWQLVRSNLLLGVGLGNFPVRFGDYISITHLPDFYDIYPGRDPHNVFLAVQGELGIPGLVILFTFLWAIFRRLWALRFEQQGMLGLSMLSFVIVSCLTTPVQYKKYFWLALGIATVIPLLKGERINESTGLITHVS